MNNLEQIDALASENKNLHFLLGALTGAYETLPKASQDHFLFSLRNKVPKADVKQRHALVTLCEALGS